jgi:hypothetical protein
MCVHAEGGDEFRIEAGGEVEQPGAAQVFRCDAGGI